MNTRDELARIRQRAEAATKGPWKAKPYWIYDSLDSRVRVTSPTDGDDHNTAEMVLLKDAEFIAHARTDIPRLLGALDAVLALADEWNTLALGDQFYARHIRAAVNDALEAGK